GGSIDNSAGLIEGITGIKVLGTTGTVTNAGTIQGIGAPANVGVYLAKGGSVDNSGLIKGAAGIYVKSSAATVTNTGTVQGTTGNGLRLFMGGTVIAAGTISGGNGTAINIANTGGPNLLVLDPGYKLIGAAYAASAVSNTLELASTASIGTATG